MVFQWLWNLERDCSTLEWSAWPVLGVPERRHRVMLPDPSWHILPEGDGAAQRVAGTRRLGGWSFQAADMVVHTVNPR
jgi:hypothetical protein